MNPVSGLPIVGGGKIGPATGGSTGRNERSIDQRMLGQLPRRPRQGIPIIGISVLIPLHHKPGSGRQPAPATGIIQNVGRPCRIDIVRPKPDLIIVPLSILILRPVKGGRRGMGGQEMGDDAASQIDRHIQMGFGGKPQHLLLPGTVIGGQRRGAAVEQQLRSRQVLPFKKLEAADFG